MATPLIRCACFSPLGNTVLRLEICAAHESAYGTKRTIAALQHFGRYWDKSGQWPTAARVIFSVLRPCCRRSFALPRRPQQGLSTASLRPASARLRRIPLRWNRLGEWDRDDGNCKSRIWGSRPALPLRLKTVGAEERGAAPRHVFLTRAVAPYLLTETVGNTPCTPSQQPLRRSAGTRPRSCGRSKPERFQLLRTRTASGRSTPPNCTAFIPHCGAHPCGATICSRTCISRRC